jgi:hypothetical protein
VGAGAIAAEPGQQQLAGLALDQAGDRRAVAGADEQIALPVARDGALVGLRGALGERDHVLDLTLV